MKKKCLETLLFLLKKSKDNPLYYRNLHSTFRNKQITSLIFVPFNRNEIHAKHEPIFY